MADATETTSASCMEDFKSYVWTRKGKILAAEILISLVIIICYAASLYSGYSTVAICEMVWAIIMFVVYMKKLDQKFAFISWLWTDIIRAALGAVLYLITSLVCVINGSGDSARIAGGVFGLLASILFGYDTYTLYLTVKGSSHTAVSTENTA